MNGPDYSRSGLPAEELPRALMIGDERYVLQQFHLHSPSEHVVDGRSYPLEAHFVHKAADKKLAVIGVLFDQGAENPALAPFWKNLPKSVGPPIDLGSGGLRTTSRRRPRRLRRCGRSSEATTGPFSRS